MGSFTLDGQRQPGQLTKMFLKMFLILLVATLLISEEFVLCCKEQRDKITFRSWEEDREQLYRDMERWRQNPSFPCDHHMAYRCKSRYRTAYFTTGADPQTYDYVKTGAWACSLCCNRNDFEGLKCQCDAINDQTFWR